MNKKKKELWYLLTPGNDEWDEYESEAAIMDAINFTNCNSSGRFLVCKLVKIIDRKVELKEELYE